MPADKNWKTTRLVDDANDEMLKQAIAHSNKIRGIEPESPPPPPPEAKDIPLDAATERDAFASLLKALADTDEGDTETVVDVLTAEAFAEEAFTPPDPPEPDA